VAEVRTETVHVHDTDVPVQIGGSGPPLVFLHGGAGAGVWLEVHDRLAAEFTVVAPVQPGFAGTPLPSWVRGIDDVALHTIELIRRLDLERPLVVGTSLGGWVATELAVFRPELLRGLVLVAPIGVRTAKPIPDLFIMEPGEALPLLFADPMKALALMPSLSGADLIVRMWEEQAATARLLWKRPYNPNLQRRLHMIECPTLVVWGAEDRLLAAEHGELLAREIPGSTLEVIPAAGHAVAVEQPEELARRIVAFAARSKPGADTRRAGRGGSGGIGGAQRLKAASTARAPRSKGRE
jgi:pimeloyl-ACP methyl ester carboxylesterase